MTITVNGNTVEAFDLIMQKKFAKEIISGKKKVEFRSFSPYYIDRFMDKAVAKRNEKAGLQWGDEGFEDDFKAIEAIHFHDYNNSWFLDVTIGSIGMFCVDTQDIDEYAGDYPEFEDYRADAIKNDELPEEDRPMLFYLLIEKIVATNLK